MAVTLETWNLKTNQQGELLLGGMTGAALADQFGTPLHVVQTAALRADAAGFIRQFSGPGTMSARAYFAVKANPVLGILALLRSAGLGAEVMSQYELQLAVAAGFTAAEVIVNGPGKSRDFLQDCLDFGPHLLVVDSLEELALLMDMANDSARDLDILLRINNGYLPRGMNSGTGTGSRKSVFGLDLKAGELALALERLQGSKHLHFQGLHCHMGSSIKHADDYALLVQSLVQAGAEVARQYGVAIKYLDLGGGFGVSGTREFSDVEFALYHGIGRLPNPANERIQNTFSEFAAKIQAGLLAASKKHRLPVPQIILEPGRCLTSRNQVLLLRIIRVKQRKDGRRWLITDGGQMTVNFPTFYEYHEMVSCRQPLAKPTEKVQVIGPGCYAADFVCRNKWLPPLKEGDVLAVMDAGAYFLPFEGNFSYPRAAVVAVEAAKPVVLRPRESIMDMISRDISPVLTECEL